MKNTATNAVQILFGSSRLTLQRREYTLEVTARPIRVVARVLRKCSQRQMQQTPPHQISKCIWNRKRQTGNDTCNLKICENMSWGSLFHATTITPAFSLNSTDLQVLSAARDRVQAGPRLITSLRQQELVKSTKSASILATVSCGDVCYIQTNVTGSRGKYRGHLLSP